jgi:hypothetical protein
MLILEPPRKSVPIRVFLPSILFLYDSTIVPSSSDLVNRLFHTKLKVCENVLIEADLMCHFAHLQAFEDTVNAEPFLYSLIDEMGPLHETGLVGDAHGDEQL